MENLESAGKSSIWAKDDIEATVSIIMSVSNQIQDLVQQLRKHILRNFFIHSQLSDIIPATTLQVDTASRHHTQ